MTLRRYASLKPSRGTVIPLSVRTGGMGRKSESIPSNLVSLSATCHRWKTEHGREARPLLLDYLGGLR